MNHYTQLANLLTIVPVAAQPQTMVLLRQVAHDVSSPAATLAMELFSIRPLLEQLRLQVGTSEALQGLEDICDNLQHVSAQLSAYVGIIGNLHAEAQP